MCSRPNGTQSSERLLSISLVSLDYAAIVATLGAFTKETSPPKALFALVFAFMCVTRLIMEAKDNSQIAYTPDKSKGRNQD